MTLSKRDTDRPLAEIIHQAIGLYWDAGEGPTPHQVEKFLDIDPFDDTQYWSDEDKAALVEMTNSLFELLLDAATNAEWSQG